jgi:hypothetical protein
MNRGERMPKNTNTKTFLRIGGNMSEKGANVAGIILSVSALVASVGLSIAAIVYVMR